MDVIRTALWVSDIDEARSFFVDGVGLDESWSFTYDGIENVYVGGSLAYASFHDWFVPALCEFLRKVLYRFRDVFIADATVPRLRRLLAEFPATHSNQSGVKLHLVHNLTK